MHPARTPGLQLPSFLHDTYDAAHQNARREGTRCGTQYLEMGSFPSPAVLDVPAREVVLTHEVSDFQRQQCAWRLHMLSGVLAGLYDSAVERNPVSIRDAYEAFCQETPWGALYFAIAPTGPVSAERTARRLHAVLRFWEPLHSARYLFKTLGSALSLDELMSAACGWALDAWCPEEGNPVHVRLERAAERMERATREDSIEAIVRQMPRALASARDLKHRDAVADATFQRQRLAALEPRAFARVSGARTAELLETLYDWDHELDRQ